MWAQITTQYAAIIRAQKIMFVKDHNDIHAHHKKELTPENVNDYNISLNPINVDLICHCCHDEQHHRFGHKPAKKVYIIYGSPMSGKKTFVAQNMERGDIVVDMDRLLNVIKEAVCPP